VSPIQQQNRQVTEAHTSLAQEFTCFSYDTDHQFRLDDSSIKYYYTPRLGADLSEGFDTFVKNDDSKAEHLDSLLKTIAAHEEKTGQKIDANLVTWRGMMTKVDLLHRG
jgi:RAT1-interacting protein